MLLALANLFSRKSWVASAASSSARSLAAAARALLRAPSGERASSAAGRPGVVSPPTGERSPSRAPPGTGDPQ
eukprot:scaffold4655_cov115-Isochrysis_galbana.AAC.9